MKHTDIENALKQNADIILTTIDSIVILIDRQGIVVAMNNAAETVTGYSQTEIVNKKHWSVFIPEDEHDKVQSVFDALIHGQKTTSTINHWINKSKEPIKIKWNNSFIRDENDDIQFVVATGIVLSGKNEDDESRLSRSLFDVSDPCMITDHNNRFIRVNKAFCEATGYSEEEVIDKTPNILSSGLHDKFFYRQMWKSIQENGSWQGEVINRIKNGNLITEYLKIKAICDDNGDITHYISVFLDISKTKENEEKLSFLSEHDAQTGLFNRNYYASLLSQDLSKIERKDTGAILYMRLRNLNSLNAYYGMKYTDAVLLKFIHQVERIISNNTQKYVLSRVSGADFAFHFIDEFDSCIENKLHLEKKVEMIITQITTLSKKFIAEVHHDAHDLMARFGVLVLPEDYITVGDDIISHAAAACQTAVKKNVDFVYYSKALQSSLEYRHNIEAALAEAISSNFEGFALYHQPQFDNKKQIIGGEALIRWNLNGKMIPPDEFIPIAEKSEIITQINRWVVTEAISQLIELQKNGLISVYNKVSINLSGICLSDSELVPLFKKQVAEFPFITQYLTLEITETAFIHDIKLAKTKVADLKHMGFKISIDDFGTGYSSLSYLAEFVFDELKIDKSFIDHIGIKTNKTYRLVKSIIGIANALEVDLIAEGIETEEQLNTLIEMNCCNFQGFYLKKPTPFPELLAFLQQERLH